MSLQGKIDSYNQGEEVRPRNVAKGYNQGERIGYFKTFAQSSKPETFRKPIVLAA